MLTRSKKGLNPPWGMPAHLEERLLTFEYACSFIHDFRSFWYESLHSLCHELSNDMPGCILFFIFSCYYVKTKNFVSGSCLQIVCARARRKSATAPPLNFWSAKLTHVRNAQRCATSDFDAVFCYGSEIRSALPIKLRVFTEPLQVAQ